jgi:hypothetical protein
VDLHRQPESPRAEDHWVFRPERPLGQAVGCLSRKLGGGDYLWTCRPVRLDPGTGEGRVGPVSRSGVVTVEDGVLSVVDAR